ncbi:MAG: hypothetical protein ACJ8C4_08815, partial [Gemmataceae bacterium]
MKHQRRRVPRGQLFVERAVVRINDVRDSNFRSYGVAEFVHGTRCRHVTVRVDDSGGYDLAFRI